ncbi:MAG: threonine synthase [Anaerolineae bacterium]|jgi:threonine synthase|nr:threonine synthase [Anaerolineae bacterium]
MACGQQYPINSVMYVCEACGGLLDVEHDLDTLRQTHTRQTFDQRLGSLDHPHKSGVWRFKELVNPDVPDDLIVSFPEGNTNLYHVPRLAAWAGVGSMHLKHEGENPTGSFKDRGMTGGVTQARVLGMSRVACASTGNTSASLAAYAAFSGLEGIVFFQNKQVAMGKLAQSVAYNATAIRIDADFDKNLELVRQVSQDLGIYVLNSINPFRLEGQKTIVFEILQQLRWDVPDWIVVPGGNLGNSSAFGKALSELYKLGWIERIPRVAVIQAEGASPFYEAYLRGFDHLRPQKAETIATAIKIGNPVNYPKAVRTIRATNGVVERVTDQEIMDAKAMIDAHGIGCEPASACSLAGVKKLVGRGIIGSSERVVGVLTGHVLKDPEAVIGYHADTLPNLTGTYANRLYEAGPSVEELARILQRNQEPMLA